MEMNQLFCRHVSVSLRMHTALQLQLGFIDYLTSTDAPTFTCYKPAVAATNLPNLDHNTLRCMWVFCDVAAPSTIGDRRAAPLLRFIPVDATTMQIAFETFTSPVQCLLSRRRGIQEVRVWISDSHDGEPLQLASDSIVRLKFSDPSRSG